MFIFIKTFLYVWKKYKVKKFCGKKFHIRFEHDSQTAVRDYLGKKLMLQSRVRMKIGRRACLRVPCRCFPKKTRRRCP
jgi:hypothetical protein